MATLPHYETDYELHVYTTDGELYRRHVPNVDAIITLAADIQADGLTIERDKQLIHYPPTAIQRFESKGYDKDERTSASDGSLNLPNA